MSYITERMKQLAGIQEGTVHITHGWGAMTAGLSKQEEGAFERMAKELEKKYEEKKISIKTEKTDHKGVLGINVVHDGKTVIRARKLTDSSQKKHHGKFLVHGEDIWGDVEKEEDQSAHVMNNFPALKSRVEQTINKYFELKKRKEKANKNKKKQANKNKKKQEDKDNKK